MEYIISVGTNIGNRKENIEKAAYSLNLLPCTEIIRTSSVYETEPVGYARQQNFYNAVFDVRSFLEPNELLGACMGIEAALGRMRTIKNGPRNIDLDIIFAEDLKINTPNLIIPHPRYSERLFVLVPLLELFEDGSVFGTYIKPFADEITNQGIKKTDIKLSV